jgi:hypothetical protein
MRRSQRKRKIRQRGGVLSTMVGNPLVYSNINSWPSGHNGNYYSNNQYINDMQTSNNISERNMYGGYIYSQKSRKSKLSKTDSFKSPNTNSRKSRGGKRRPCKNKSRKRRHFFRGGFPLLDDVRLGTEVVGTNLQNIINTSTGNPSQVSPLPYMNQFNRNI